MKELRGILDFDESTDIMRSLDTALAELRKAIKNLKNDIANIGSTNPDIVRISEIKGVSLASASMIVSYLIDKTFDKKFQIVAYTGLDITVKQSGTSVNDVNGENQVY